MLVNLLIIGVLLLIFLQDIRSHSVYWFLFPLLAASLLILKLQSQFIGDAWQSILFNISFLALQLFILTVYFSVNNKKWVNVTRKLLGWGDILFLLSIAFYLSVLNYLFFYVASLLLILSFWLIRNLITQNKYNYIPLAGLQALIFAILLTGYWCCHCFDPTDDTWLLPFITK